MQRQEFLQQLWLDYIHLHPGLGALRLWPLETKPEYLALLTVNQGHFSTAALLPALKHFGYRCVDRFAMADRGLLATLLAAPDDGSWLVLGELQLGALTKEARERLGGLISQVHPPDSRGQNLLCRGRPWPMPDWHTYTLLHEAHPLAGWLSIMGPRLHHAGFDCQTLGQELSTLDRQLQQSGLVGDSDRHRGVFPISPLLHYRYYPCCPQRLAFADGDEHRVSLGGLALVQKCLPNHLERTAELLLPHHTRCAIA